VEHFKLFSRADLPIRQDGKSGKKAVTLCIPPKARAETMSTIENMQDSQKLGSAPGERMGQNYLTAWLLAQWEVGAMNKIALQIYFKVADLVQKGQTEQARELAVKIPLDYLRDPISSRILADFCMPDGSSNAPTRGT